MFRDMVSLNTAFERNPDYINGEKKYQEYIKRPLLMVLAAGYVLGEVLVLQVHGAEDMTRMACVYAVAAMLLWWEETGALRRLSIRKKEQQETGIPGLFCSFCHAFCYQEAVGPWRAGRRRNRLDEEERWAALMQECEADRKGGRFRDKRWGEPCDSDPHRSCRPGWKQERWI